MQRIRDPSAHFTSLVKAFETDSIQGQSIGRPRESKDLIMTNDQSNEDKHFKILNELLAGEDEEDSRRVIAAL
jgi:hypothetical protein